MAARSALVEYLRREHGLALLEFLLVGDSDLGLVGEPGERGDPLSVLGTGAEPCGGAEETCPGEPWVGDG